MGDFEDNDVDGRSWTIRPLILDWEEFSMFVVDDVRSFVLIVETFVVGEYILDFCGSLLLDKDNYDRKSP